MSSTPSMSMASKSTSSTFSGSTASSLPSSLLFSSASFFNLSSFFLIITFRLAGSFHCICKCFHCVMLLFQLVESSLKRSPTLMSVTRWVIFFAKIQSFRIFWASSSPDHSYLMFVKPSSNVGRVNLPKLLDTSTSGRSTWEVLRTSRAFSSSVNSTRTSSGVTSVSISSGSSSTAVPSFFCLAMSAFFFLISIIFRRLSSKDFFFCAISAFCLFSPSRMLWMCSKYPVEGFPMSTVAFLE
mmetsp:Transcript_18855/g.40495  ORF Transcript_18855/g.40495 Transcript_18855/m.40495 type:complete len:241 (+) Transcript_18855:998-1720(+)